MQVPRYTYLPLLIPEIRENLVELALDDQAFAESNEKYWWFEEDPVDDGEGGGVGGFAPQGPCKWYVPARVHLDMFPSRSTIFRYLVYNLANLIHDGVGADDRHWPLDLIHLHSIISHPYPSSPSSSSSSIIPVLRLRLHLSNPPNDKLNLPKTIEQCHTQWVNQVKEADFVRWRNTSRTTGLRKGEFDAGWDGILNGE